MKVYYFSKPLEHGPTFLWMVSSRARHAGVMIDDAHHGLVKIEISLNKHKEKKINFEKIDEFHRQTDSNKGDWAYEMGETHLSYENVVEISEKWIADHPSYDAFNDNCRTFTSAILTILIKENGTYNANISKHRFKNSPCEEAEHRIKEDGFNVPHRIRSTSTQLKAKL
jgi:hypothetical protein